jgi:GntR family transcriptional regulator
MEHHDKRPKMGRPVTPESPDAEIDRDSKLPYYAQLKRALVAQIDSGELKPGDLLPAEYKLCEQFQVSRTVVRQALAELTSEGRVYRLRGKGTFVTGRKLSERFTEPSLGFFDDLAAAGHAVINQVGRCAPVTVGDAVARKLNLAPGAQCIEFDRLRYVNGEVSAYMRSYLPYDLGPKLLQRLRKFDLEHNSLYRFLEGIIGVSITSGHRVVVAVPATPQLAQSLQVRAGDPLLYIESIEKDTAGRHVEYSEAWHRSDRFRLELDVVRRQ